MEKSLSQEKKGKMVLYVSSGIAVTVGMLVLKGLATVVNYTVAFLLGVH